LPKRARAQARASVAFVIEGEKSGSPGWHASRSHLTMAEIGQASSMRSFDPKRWRIADEPR
jgi:hypothetical protein